MTTAAKVFTRTRNGTALPLSAVPESPFDLFRGAVIERVSAGGRLCALFAVPGAPPAIWAVVADDAEGRLELARTRLEGDRFPTLSIACPQAHLFEREMAEQLGIHPDGHPWLKPVRFQTPFGRTGAHPRAGVMPYFRVEGEEVHEVAVGPVHAGVIEPGHFRFQCHGEEVLHLEISLGYQHRGIEEDLIGGPHKTSLHRVETLAGDTTAGHTVAWCQALEALSGVQTPARAHALRAVALELERLANHTGDLGALSGDVGYLPTASFCGRLRGDFLGMTALLCGSRFGRGFVRPGGTAFDLDEEMRAALAARLEEAARDLAGAVDLLWETSSVVARFEGTGALTEETCREVGIVGPAARACGVPRDVRHDHPTGIYPFVHLPVMTTHRGDVQARAFVRWLEARQSIDFLRERLASLPQGPVRAPATPLAADRVAVSLVEGWRGEICHVAITGGDGRLARYKVVDPSFHNWLGLALAMRGQEISDFPLVNKSFNLSYCGHDL